MEKLITHKWALRENEHFHDGDFRLSDDWDTITYRGSGVVYHIRRKYLYNVEPMMVDINDPSDIYLRPELTIDNDSHHLILTVYLDTVQFLSIWNQGIFSGWMPNEAAICQMFNYQYAGLAWTLPRPNIERTSIIYENIKEWIVEREANTTRLRYNAGSIKPIGDATNIVCSTTRNSVYVDDNVNGMRMSTGIIIGRPTNVNVIGEWFDGHPNTTYLPADWKQCRGIVKKSGKRCKTVVKANNGIRPLYCGHHKKHNESIAATVTNNSNNNSAATLIITEYPDHWYEALSSYYSCICIKSQRNLDNISKYELNHCRFVIVSNVYVLPETIHWYRMVVDDSRSYVSVPSYLRWYISEKIPSAMQMATILECLSGDIMISPTEQINQYMRDNHYCWYYKHHDMMPQVQEVEMELNMTREEREYYDSLTEHKQQVRYCLIQQRKRSHHSPSIITTSTKDSLLLGGTNEEYLKTVDLNSFVDRCCCICLEDINEQNAGITVCGHLYCYSPCLTKLVNQLHQCAQCKTELPGPKSIFLIQNDTAMNDEDDDEDENEDRKRFKKMREKHGTKMAWLLHRIATSNNNTNKPIILLANGGIKDWHHIDKVIGETFVWPQDNIKRQWRMINMISTQAKPIVFVRNDSCLFNLRHVGAEELIFLQPNLQYKYITKAIQPKRIVTLIMKDTIESDIYRNSEV